MNVELLQLLSLIIVANGAPILARALFNENFNIPVDFNRTLPDKRPVFGASKTWRGIIAALLVTAIVAWILNLSPLTGLLVALYAVVGDLVSSFVKRRLAMKPSSMAPLLDQVPESLFPAFILMDSFNLDKSSVIQLVLIFIILELVLSHILYKWGIRKRPY